MPTPVIPANYTPLALTSLGGFVGSDGNPINTLGENLNWFYCHHNPPIVCAAPAYRHADALGYYVFPLRYPSADSLAYEVWIGIRSASAQTVQVLTELGAVTEPQPTTDAHWGGGTYWSDTMTAGESVWFKMPDPLNIDPSDRDIRVKVYGYAALTGVLVRPAVITSLTAGAKPSGAIPWVNDLLVDMGPVTPEHINRIWTSTGRVAADRTQVVASAVFPAGDPGHFIQWTRFLCTPTYLAGQSGATLTAHLYAKGSTTGGEVTVGERGGASVALAVTTDATDYHYVSGTFNISTDGPVIVATSTGLGVIDVMYCVVTWTPGD